MNRCLFCKSTTNLFTSVEHVVPEGLGNEKFVLPRGVVCDRCNNGVLARLDAFLIHHPMIAFQRVHLNILSKSGKRPKARWGNGTFERVSDDEMRFTTNSRKAAIPNASGVTLNLKSARKTKESDVSQLARALYRSALAFIYYDHGDLAYHPMFDETRRVILGKTLSAGWVAIPKTAKPTKTFNLKYVLTDLARMKPVGPEEFLKARYPAIGISMDVYGLVIMTEMLHRNPVHSVSIPPGFNVLRFSFPAGNLPDLARKH